MPISYDTAVKVQAKHLLHSSRPDGIVKGVCCHSSTVYRWEQRLQMYQTTDPLLYALPDNPCCKITTAAKNNIEECNFRADFDRQPAELYMCSLAIIHNCHCNSTWFLLGLRLNSKDLGCRILRCADIAFISILRPQGIPLLSHWHKRIQQRKYIWHTWSWVCIASNSTQLTNCDICYLNSLMFLMDVYATVENCMVMATKPSAKHLQRLWIR